MILHATYIHSLFLVGGRELSLLAPLSKQLAVKSYYFLIMFDKVGNLCYKLCEAVGNGDKNLLAVSSAFVWVR